MANFEGRTASNGAELKSDMLAAFNSLVDKYDFGDTTVGAEENHIHFYGYDWPSVRKITIEDDDDDDDYLDEFLEALAPMLKEPFVIQMIGAEKCRFPLSASEVIIFPSGKKVWNGFFTETYWSKEEGDA